MSDDTPDKDTPDKSKAAPRRRTTRRRHIGCSITLGLLVGAFVVVWAVMIRMPGSSHEGPLPDLTEAERGHADSMRRDVTELAAVIGERHTGTPAALKRAADFMAKRLAESGYQVKRMPFEADGQSVENLEVELTGGERKKEIVVVGGHYDGAINCPAANDNGSGAAALLALAKAFAGKKLARTIRFVAFVNEEPPHFQKATMGSLVYAAHCRKGGDDVVAMLSLETMGYFTDRAETQRYPFPLSMFYPDTGNFIAVVGDLSSRELVHRVIGSLRGHTEFPTEGAALPAGIPGVGWSDHWSFWQHGYPGVMITDTAPFRYPHYHELEDTPDKVDYKRLARVVAGLERVVAELAGG